MFHLDPSVRNIGGRFADDPDLDPFGQIAVLKAGARVAPGLTDLGRPHLVLHVDLQDPVGIPQADSLDDAGQIDTAAGCPRPAVMGQSPGHRSREAQGQDRDEQDPGHRAPPMSQALPGRLRHSIGQSSRHFLNSLQVHDNHALEHCPGIHRFRLDDGSAARLGSGPEPRSRCPVGRAFRTEIDSDHYVPGFDPLHRTCGRSLRTFSVTPRPRAGAVPCVNGLRQAVSDRRGVGPFPRETQSI